MRLVAPEKVLSLIPGDARRVGLVGAAVTDHPRITDMVGDIVRSGREIGISSLRADRLSEELVGLLRQGGYRTLTTASDGVSQRLRDSVQRRTNEQHLIRAAELARKYQLERLKLYEMIGLPGETLDDIDELVRFSLELARIAPLSLAISPFVAKRNTPLDGAPFESIHSLEGKLARLRAGLKDKVEIRSDLRALGLGRVQALAGRRGRRHRCARGLARRRELRLLEARLRRHRSPAASVSHNRRAVQCLNREVWRPRGHMKMRLPQLLPWRPSGP